MTRKLLIFLFLITFLQPLAIECKLPQLTPKSVSDKVNEIMKAHASYKELSPELVVRILQNYLDDLDPNKTYFLQSDIQQWLIPTPELINAVLEEYKTNKFSIFFEIHNAMLKTIPRRHELENQINLAELPKKVSVKEFRDIPWAKSSEELLERLKKIKALQLEASMKLNPELRDKAFQRIAKRQTKSEEELLNSDSTQRERKVLSNVLKATAAALDAHTSYFTPDEAAQFMISVQQRLFGIGVQLRDDINGFTVVKIIEGGPSALGKQLKVKDRIIAVDGEPVVGMDIMDAIDLIRGEKNTTVTLTVIREIKGDDSPPKDEKLDINIKRDEVVLKETRFSTSYEPFGDGVIGYLRLYAFYQDPQSSSATDLRREIEHLEKEHNLKGIILDLRYNIGGLLAQAVDVTGLFITKGIVASVKDHTGSIQHLRDTDDTVVWDGPLVVLINRASASAAEIVAQALQDYGRAVIVGDDHSFGKGSFQTFTLNTTNDSATLANINPEGEYKVTRGRYYTVSGKTPQLTGVHSDIIFPGALSFSDVGEKYAKYPLANDQIKPNYDDDLSDVPYTQRARLRMLYKFGLQEKLSTYQPYMERLKANSGYRVEHNKQYQAFINKLKQDSDSIVEVAEGTELDEPVEPSDFQLNEAFNVMKDLIILLQVDKKTA